MEEGNYRLHRAMVDDDDEFYTRISDIERELKHYNGCFRDKVVYCPCDTASGEARSQFFNYFSMNFHRLGIKRLICTAYSRDGKGTRWVYDGDLQDDTIITDNILKTTILCGNGSFDSPECRKIMEESDVIVTNPPFSLFRKFIGQIVSMGKEFLIIGNKNVTIYRDIFPLIKDNRIWLGCTQPKGFDQPEGAEKRDLGGLTYWFTNLKNGREDKWISLTKPYNEADYPKYENYNAIEVAKVKNIPKDYYGLMGVPVSFLVKYNPRQFEIVWQASGNTKASTSQGILEELGYIPHPDDKNGCPMVNGKRAYARILIRRKKDFPD